MSTGFRVAGASLPNSRWLGRAKVTPPAVTTSRVVAPRRWRTSTRAPPVSRWHRVLVAPEGDQRLVGDRAGHLHHGGARGRYWAQRLGLGQRPDCRGDPVAFAIAPVQTNAERVQTGLGLSVGAVVRVRHQRWAMSWAPFSTEPLRQA
jgi:hypothetical protein